MRYDEKRKRFVPTTTEIIERERRLWKIRRDELPDHDVQSWHYFNGGMEALSDLRKRLVRGDDVKNA
jgi:hypothetical protein